jgi:hypothetical protein
VRACAINLNAKETCVAPDGAEHPTQANPATCPGFTYHASVLAARNDLQESTLFKTT